MDKEGLLRVSLLAVAALMVVVGLATLSLKKMAATYAFGVAGAALFLLPDWEFFDRDFSQWFSPMEAPRRNTAATAGAGSGGGELRFKPYPFRVAVLTTIYCYGLYKWWVIVSS